MILVIAYGIFLLPIQVIMMVIELIVRKRFFSSWSILLAISFLIGLALILVIYSVDVVKWDNGLYTVIAISVIGIVTSVIGLIVSKRKCA